MGSRRITEFAADATAHALAISAAVIWTLPLVWFTLASFKDPTIVSAVPPKWVFTPTLANYHKVLLGFPFARYALNSCIISLGTTVGTLGIAIPAAFAIARYRVAGAIAPVLVLTVRMLPSIVLALPLFIVFNMVGLIDTPLALIFGSMTLQVPLATWLLIGFIGDLPREFEEAALIDGCSAPQALMRVTLPLLRPGVTTTAVLTFMFAWNEFVFALVLSQYRAKPLSVAAADFVTSYAIAWGEVAAAATLIVLPVIGLGLISQRQLIRGLTLGGLRG